MERCGFFNEHFKNMSSNELHSHQQVAHTNTIRYPWCSHPKHSPAVLRQLLTMNGGPRLLQCGGDFERCQIPPDKFPDVA